MGNSIESMNLDQLWEHILKVLQNNPEPIQDVNLQYQITLTGTESRTYKLTLQDGVAQVESGEDLEAPCHLTMDMENFKKLLLGKLNSTAAYMTGKLKVKGNIGLALKLESLLKRYRFE